MSDHGRVRSLIQTQVRILKSSLSKGGYPQVTLYESNRRSSHQIHWLVLHAFIGPRPDGLEGCHNNGNKLDNRLENLRYDTRPANVQDRKDHGGYPRLTHCLRNHLLSDENTYIDPKNRQICKTCRRQRDAVRRSKASVV